MTMLKSLLPLGLISATCLLAPVAAHAGSITLDVTFNIEETYLAPDSFPLEWAYAVPQVGDRSHATLVVDDNLRHISGALYATKALSFKGQLAQNVWDSSNPMGRYIGENGIPINRDFAGYRSYCYNSLGYHCTSEDSNAFSSNIGLEIVDGVIKSLQFGVVGQGDIPYIDFYNSTGRFNSTTMLAYEIPPVPQNNYQGRTSFGYISLLGTVDVQRVPEPAPIALLGIGLLALGLRRKAQGSKA